MAAAAAGADAKAPAPVAVQFGACVECEKPVDSTDGFQLVSCPSKKPIHFACVECKHCSEDKRTADANGKQYTPYQQAAIQAMGPFIRAVKGFSNEIREEIVITRPKLYTVDPDQYQPAPAAAVRPIPQRRRQQPQQPH